MHSGLDYIKRFSQSMIINQYYHFLNNDKVLHLLSIRIIKRLARTSSGRAKLAERLSVQIKHPVIIHIACKEEQPL